MSREPGLWENFDRNQLPLLAEALVFERAGHKTCSDELPVEPYSYWCSRKPGHASERHIAMAGHLIIAAWPGDHMPCLTDMEA